MTDQELPDTPTPVRDLLREASRRLAEGGVASPEYDAAELLAHVLGTTRGQLPLTDAVQPAASRRTTASSAGGRPGSRSST